MDVEEATRMFIRRLRGSLDEKKVCSLDLNQFQIMNITWRGKEDRKRNDPSTLEQGYMIMIFPFPF